MVFTTPCCARIDFLRWLLVLCFAWCGTAVAGEGIHVQSAELTRNGSEYYLDANFEVGLTHTLEDALNKGLPLHFIVEFELIKPRWYTLYLWNKSVFEFRQQSRLSYNALTRQYRLSTGALHQNFDSLDEALALLGRVRPRFVGDADMLYDQFSVQTGNFFGQKIVNLMNGNLPLLQNTVEQLSGDSNLIAVRGRATMDRPFTVVKRMQAQAEEGYRGKLKELEKSLQETQSRLNDLQKNKESGQRFILSPEQQAEVKNFQKKEAEVKKELKKVKRDLSREIEALETRLKWVNIAAMPFLVTISGISLALFKRKQTAAK